MTMKCGLHPRGRANDQTKGGFLEVKIILDKEIDPLLKDWLILT
jgi:hypothetical protein